jgi:hypothetical protein
LKYIGDDQLSLKLNSDIRLVVVAGRRRRSYRGDAGVVPVILFRLGDEVVQRRRIYRSPSFLFFSSSHISPPSSFVHIYPPPFPHSFSSNAPERAVDNTLY